MLSLLPFYFLPPLSTTQQTANHGRVTIVGCEKVGDTAYRSNPPGCYGEHNIGPDMLEAHIEGYPVQKLSFTAIEKWDTCPKRGESWTCRDLCEVILTRYREKHPEMMGSWLFGARNRWAVVGDDGDEGGFSPPGSVTLTPFLGNFIPVLNIVNLLGK